MALLNDPQIERINATQADDLVYLLRDPDGTPIDKSITAGDLLAGTGGGDFSDGGEAGGKDRSLGNTDNFSLGLLTNGVEHATLQTDGGLFLSATGSGTGLQLNIGGAVDAIISNGTNLYFGSGSAGSNYYRVANTKIHSFQRTGVGVDFQVDGSGNVIATNQVGINESSPAAKLHIQTSALTEVGQIIRGSVGQDADLLQVQASDGTPVVGMRDTNTAAKPALRFGSANSGLYESATYSISVSSNGTQSLVINASYTAIPQSGGVYLKRSSFSAATPSIAFWGDSNTGLWNSAADTLQFVTEGTAALTIDPSQNVGIGETAPESKLHVQTSALDEVGQIIRGSVGQDADLLQVQASDGTNVVGMRDLNAAATPSLWFGDGNSGFYESANNVLGISFNGVRRWIWDSAYFASSAVGGGRITRYGANVAQPQLTFYGDDDSGVYRGNENEISLVTGGVAALTIDPSQNVGLKTSTFDGTAAGVFALADGTAPAAGTAGQSYIYAKDVTGTSKLFYMDGAGVEVELGAGGGGGGDFSDGGEAGGKDRSLGNTDAFALSLLTNNVEALTIAANQRIGINQGTPTAMLDIIPNTVGTDGLVIQRAAGQNSGRLFTVRSEAADLFFYVHANGSTFSRAFSPTVDNAYWFGGPAQNWARAYCRNVFSDSTLALYSNSLKAVTINVAQKVGIGNELPVAKLDVQTSALDEVGQIIRGSVGQDADLLQVQDSDGNNQTSILANGDLFFENPSSTKCAIRFPNATSTPLRVLSMTGAGGHVEINRDSMGNTRYYCGTSHFHTFYSAGAVSFVVQGTSAKNVGIGTLTFNGTAAGTLAIADGTAPAAGTAGQSYIYAKDVAGTSKIFMMDGDGNETQMTTAAGSSAGVHDEWTYESRNVNTGRGVRIDMIRALRALEDLTGLNLIQELY